MPLKFNGICYHGSEQSIIYTEVGRRENDLNPRETNNLMKLPSTKQYIFTNTIVHVTDFTLENPLILKNIYKLMILIFHWAIEYRLDMRRIV